MSVVEIVDREVLVVEDGDVLVLTVGEVGPRGAAGTSASGGAGGVNPALDRLGKIARTAQVGAFRNPRSSGLWPGSVTVTTGSSPAMSPTGDYEAALNGSPYNTLAPNHPFTFSGGAPYINNNVGGLTFPSLREGASSGGNIDNSGRTARTWRLHFMTDSDLVSIRLLGYRTPYRLLVDGQFLSLDPYLTADSGGSQYLHLDFGTRAPLGRKITVEGAGSAAFWAVYVRRTCACWPIDTADRITLGVIGDSISTGTGATLQNDAFPVVMGDYLGADDIWSMGIGGTGYVQNAAGLNYAQHLGDWTVAKSDWDLLVFTGGNNDGTVWQNDPSGYETAVAAIFTATRAALPGVPIVVFGPTTAPSTVNLGIEAVLEAVVAARADPLMRFVRTQAPWFGPPEIFGTGHVGNEQGDGNADLYVGVDGAHPPTEGHAYLGHRRAMQTRMAVLDMLAAT